MSSLQAHIPEQEQLYMHSCKELKELFMFIAVRMCKLIAHHKKSKTFHYNELEQRYRQKSRGESNSDE
jgi:hypothetical protein